MPSRNGGMRRPVEEKMLLAELSKIFHVAKANHKEQRNAHHTSSRGAAAAAPAADERQRKKMSSRSAVKDTRRGSQRRSQHGGSIWMVMKGGFAPRVVPLASNVAVVDARAQQRAALSEARRVAALKEAEAFVESAWQQARESELVNSDNTPTEEGDAYLAEQYATASAMLAPAPVGAFLHQLVDTHGAAAGTPENPSTTPDFALSRAEWEDVCTREAAILFRYRTSATPATSAEDYFKEQQHAREQRYGFTTAEPTVSSGADAAPTKCIVRLRDSQRNKHTSVLSTAKAINYFKSNIGQVLRKELAGSSLPRGAAGEAESGAAAATAATSLKGSQKPANTAHSPKKRRKR
ncbi:hypothetical protein ABL78_5600 [Leptomonas seymouri]|uniref:Uncharacterized protein n=1 Tax=Leptomonas seymouri TaxID=5684 RepID=A0A0N1HWM5_LEPSE|nr:hypothetical protein ABL78_5600 [Leptomonas seymouri]|eukprot:KPI85345.1 hypothetical protein ABL78_5600 [Leptomonas seymouri]